MQCHHRSALHCRESSFFEVFIQLMPQSHNRGNVYYRLLEALFGMVENRLSCSNTTARGTATIALKQLR